MLPILQIGPLALRLPLLLALVGLILGISFAERRLPKAGLTANQLNTLVFLALGGGLLAARLAFAAQHFSLFSRAPLTLLSPDGGLLDPWAGAIVGLLAMMIYAQRQKLELWSTLDALTPLLAVWGVFLGLAAAAAGEPIGNPTALPWGIELWGVQRHPLPLYYSLAALLILAGFWRRWGQSRFAGEVFLQFTLVCAAALLVLETWRADSPLLPGGWRTLQVLCWLIMAASFVLLERRAASKH